MSSIAVAEQSTQVLPPDLNMLNVQQTRETDEDRAFNTIRDSIDSFIDREAKKAGNRIHKFLKYYPDTDILKRL